jgi:hypothetical protein
MPHPSDNIGVDLNNYLAALDKYNLAYGPQPQGTGGTGGQNFAVRSSTEAPGFGYVNPETNALFPLYPQEAAGAAGAGAGAGGPPQDQFHDYLESIGAQQMNTGFKGGTSGGAFDGWSPYTGGYTTNMDLIKPEHPWTDQYGNTKAYKDIRTPQQYGAPTTAGNTPSYVLPQDEGAHTFLGYGGSADELFKNTPKLQRQYYEQLFAQNPPPEEL